MTAPGESQPPDGAASDVTDAISSEVARKTKSLSRDLILQFHALTRVASFHSMGNDAAQQALDKLTGTIAALFELQYDVTMLYCSKDFYINEVRIKASMSNFEIFDKFGAFLERRGVGSLGFKKIPERETLETVVTVLNEVQIGGETQPWQAIQKQLAQAGLTEMELTPYAGDALEDLPVIDKRTFTKQAYFRAISVAQQLFEQARGRKPLALKNGKRIVQNFVDLITDPDPANSDLLILLTGVKNWRGYLFNHAVNTCILSLGLGQALGLEREALRELGMAALLADIGNAVLPEEMLDSPTRFDEARKRIVKAHPFAGVPLIAGYQQLDRVVLKSVMGCLTHHRGYEGAGYPRLPFEPKGINRHVIAVCDRYDAMTTPRGHRPNPLAPPDALAELRRLAGTQLHPTVVKAFVEWAGALPTGTVVVLSTGEVALIITPPTREKAARVRVLRTEGGSLAQGQEVDVGSDHGRRVRGVVDRVDEDLAHRATAALVV